MDRTVFVVSVTALLRILSARQDEYALGAGTLQEGLVQLGHVKNVAGYYGCLQCFMRTNRYCRREQVFLSVEQ